MDAQGVPVGMIAPIANRNATGSRTQRFEEVATQYATEENLTDLALKRWEACHTPRLRQIMQSLIKHLHGFVREVDLTESEWLMAANWLAKTGQFTSEKRHE